MIACWVLFPLVLAALTLGCGLLVEALAGRRLPATLLLPVGYALIVVVAQVPAQWDATAELGIPVAIALALVGLGLGLTDRGALRRLRPDPWAAGAALLVFAVFAAPVVLTGEATFTGYIRLDDTASWLGLADRAMTHGTSLAGLQPSSYEAMLQFYLGSAYPIGGLVPLGIAGRLSGQELAWVWQPHLAFLAALLALGLWEVARSAIVSRPARAVTVVVAAQAASLFGYTMWGGFKELATAALLPTVAVLAADAGRGRVALRGLIALGIVSAAFLGMLSVGGAAWLVLVLVPVVVAVARSAGARAAAQRTAVVGGLVVVLSIPAIVTAGFLDAPAASTITQQDRLANLIQPLHILQIFGVWPSGDFRLRPEQADATYVLIGVVAAAALFGLAMAWRARRHTLVLYVAGTIAGALGIYAFGSPWVDAKALSIAAPASLLAAGVGAAWLWRSGRRVEAGVLAMAVVGGVVWSNVLAYRDVTIAPRDRLAELIRIDDRFEGTGPTLVTEFEPYAARYLLRGMTPEVAGELRRRIIPLRNGGQVPKGGTADLDAFQLDAVLTYRNLVLRRSPLASRPPSVYEQVWSGRYYEVWQRPATPSAQVVEHLSLGGAEGAGSEARCGDVLRLAGAVGPGGRLLAAPAPQASPALVRQVAPANAFAAGVEGGADFHPLAGGRLETTVDVPRAGRYRLWVPGATRSGLQAFVDGVAVGEERAELSYDGQFMPFATVELTAGPHEVSLRYGGADGWPGSKGDEFAIGPPVLSLDVPRPALRSYAAAQAQQLCGRSFDWIEAVRAST